MIGGWGIAILLGALAIAATGGQCPGEWKKGGKEEGRRANAACGWSDEDKEKGLRSEFLQGNGVKLHLVSRGEGTTVLFLHGFPEFWYAWKNQLDRFGGRYRAAALDMRGYNLSEKPTRVEDYAVPILVADIAAILDRISPGRKAVLVGHDWGGAMAWLYAMQHPDRLERLVIINAPHPAIFTRELATNPAQQKASAYMNLFRSPEAEALLSANDYAALAVAVFGGARPGAFSEEDRGKYREAWSRPGALTGGLNYYRAANLGPPAADGKGGQPPALRPNPRTGGGLGTSQGLGPVAALGTLASATQPVRVPTLVLWGEKDGALLTGNLERLERYVPDLKVVRFPEAGHWIVHEEPERVNREIERFLGG